MPTYTYHCDNCGIRFDQYQKFSDDSLVVCPECGEPTLRKVFQPVGIVFKGKGFYATDNRSPSGQTYSSDKEKDDSGKKTPESKNGTKNETKKESKNDSKNDSKPDKSKSSDD